MNELRRHGITPTAVDHIPGYPQPLPIRGHIPDITAYSRAQALILEAETPDSIGLAEAQTQWNTFAKHAAQTNGVFIAVVPQQCKALAELLLCAGPETQRWTLVWTF